MRVYERGGGKAISHIHFYYLSMQDATLSEMTVKYANAENKNIHTKRIFSEDISKNYMAPVRKI